MCLRSKTGVTQLISSANAFALKCEEDRRLHVRPSHVGTSEGLCPSARQKVDEVQDTVNESSMSAKTSLSPACRFGQAGEPPCTRSPSHTIVSRSRAGAVTELAVA